VVERHAPRHAFSETCHKRRVAQTECAYSDFALAAE
jgi:hypothetical protein